MDALRGADQQSVQRRRRSRSSGPSSRYVPGQQRQQHQQPLHGWLRWTPVTGRTVFKSQPERPIGLKLKEGIKDKCRKCSCTTTYPKTLTLYPVTLHSEENIPEVYHTEYNHSLSEAVPILVL